MDVATARCQGGSAVCTVPKHHHAAILHMQEVFKNAAFLRQAAQSAELWQYSVTNTMYNDT
jgi:hypothetical protein